jgi:putative nucleotidyltransferase with HDIG domain
MSEPVRFLISLSQALSTLALYGEGHPATARATGAAHRHLADLQDVLPRSQFTFLPGEVLFGRELLPELENWEWSGRLAQGGIERLEITGSVDSDQFERFLSHAAAILGLRPGGGVDLWQAGPTSPIRFGRVRVDGARSEATTAPLTIATLGYSLREEQDAMGWVHQEVASSNQLPVAEAYGVVRSLSLAMHSGRAMVLPLLQLKEFDQYTTTHSINVSVLTMGLAEFLGLGPSTVRAFGLAGLLHDLGKTKIPQEILTKPGKLTPAERLVVEAHPGDGARMILEGKEPMNLAAAVAYEHHRCHDGTGYPHLHYPRQAHQASRLVHVCDVYDALRTRRPYRDAWSSEEALEYIVGRVGTEFEPAMAASFVDMMRRWDDRIELQSAEPSLPSGGGMHPGAAPASPCGQEVADDELAVPSGVLDEQAVRVVAARDHSG